MTNMTGLGVFQLVFPLDYYLNMGFIYYFVVDHLPAYGPTFISYHMSLMNHH